MNAISWNMNRNQDNWRTAMIEEARALLSLIDAAHVGENIDEDPVARKTRLIMRQTAGWLVAEMIAQLWPATAVPQTVNHRRLASRLVWS